ncbi:MAG: ABC transporter permease [Proteobacteria bacterium]|nr:ABC transporter permease [Pseudomonadota bacterium]HQR04623.1 ABC transporter permease [Rhodocyclaceae bacterium]
MRSDDAIRFILQSLMAHRLRTVLSALGIAIGITAVILLTSIGQGLHRFVIDEFTQFGTNIIGITPGHTDTRGGPIGAINTVRPLSIDDALALRQIPQILAADPTVQGNGEVENGSRSRRVMIYGASHVMTAVMHMKVAAGSFLPDDDPRSARAFTVLGAKVARELFDEENPLGARVRIGGERYRVIGVMEAKGQVLGFDLDDTVYIPVGRALEMFNRDSLMEIHLSYEPTVPLATVEAEIRQTLNRRHGREDYTVTPQQKMLETFGTILDTLTFAIAAIGGISLLVGGIGILTILTIAVSERTSEIGLLRAIGATRRRILTLFLGEAALLAALGGITGLTLGWGIALLLKLTVPALPVNTPWSYAVAAELTAVIVGLLAGVLPARRAARLDPLEALRSE